MNIFATKIQDNVGVVGGVGIGIGLLQVVSLFRNQPKCLKVAKTDQMASMHNSMVNGYNC